MEGDSSHPLCECTTSNACILHAFLEPHVPPLPALPSDILPAPSQDSYEVNQHDLLLTIPQTPSPPPNQPSAITDEAPVNTAFTNDHQNEVVPSTPPPPSGILHEAAVSATPPSDHQNEVVPSTLPPPDKYEALFTVDENSDSTANCSALITPYNVAATTHPAVDRKLTEEGRSLLGRHVPINTSRSTVSSLSVFCRFYAKRYKVLRQGLLDVLDDASAPLWRRRSVEDQIIPLSRMDLFKDEHGVPLPPGFSKWKDWQLRRINNALIDFIAQYRNQRTGAQLAPTTLKAYIAGLQRAFLHEWGYELNLFTGKVFSDKRIGLITALDNKIRQRQADGAVRRSHNNLCTEDIVKLYASESLSFNTPRGFMTRIVMDLLFITGFRRSEMYSLRMKDVTLGHHNGVKVYRIAGQIGSADGASKTQSGGLVMVNAKPKEIFAFDMDLFGGSINIFKDIEKYLSIVGANRAPEDRFLAPVNYRATRQEAFFKKGNLGMNTISTYIKDACTELGIRGEGVFDHVTVHSFRATVVSQLKAAGFSDASVSLRTGHRDFRSLTAYHNLRGDLGRQQQAAIFGADISVAAS
eukprot:TRINITY_DN209_c1_g1_i5.p1 TRINITY_DN209_c1_g1~~TRINITY_DN209_c1_g1_i5.p1  ORF type:complete len:581 (-),score=76.72 TRINITY_DN209_c1_g1_i5:978-2720(-)